MCRVKWCDKVDRFYKNGNPKPQCSIHIQYSDWVTNTTSRPHLMYKLEKILEGDLCCEACSIDKQKQFPNESLRLIVSFLDVDHIKEPTKDDVKNNPYYNGRTKKIEHPNNYNLLCTDCHKIKSHKNGDNIRKDYR